MGDLPLDERVALAASYLINPMCLPPLAFGLILSHFQASSGEIGLIVSIAFLVFCIIPVAYIVWKMRCGVIAELDVPERKNRTGVLLVSMGAIVVGGILIYQVGVTVVPLMVSIMVSYLINTVVLLVINLFWKISIHLIGLAGVWATLFFVMNLPDAGTGVIQGTWMIPVLLLIPFLMWARVRLGAHTRAQVVVGAIVGLLGQYGVLYLINDLSFLS